MAQCWERRGCDEEMMSRCPHNIPGEPCPADCRFAACTRSTHEVCQDFNKLLNPERDYDAAVKEVCRFCEHFRTGFCSSRANRFETRASARSARQSQRATAAVQDICAAARYPHTSKEPTKGRRWQSRLTAR